jgi:peptide/nickel transport system substrate-binding protein
MLGIGDVDYMDPSVSYFTVGNEGLRLWSRNLYTYPAVPGKTSDVAPDLAAALPKVSSDGTTYTVTIRKGAMWNTSTPRQVSGADAVRGLERSCNPAQPSGAVADYVNLVQGMSAFCTAFEKVSPTVSAINAFLKANSISGVNVSPTDPLTVTYKLTQPTTYFTGLLALTQFAPVPAEYLNYVPASAALAQHTIADGPYMIKSYVPARSIDFVRNPAWKASTDPIRKAYVDEVKVNETGNATSIQQQIAANTPAADLEWGTATPPPSDIPSLMASKDARLVTGPTFGINPYIVFNFLSPNNGGALTDLGVRQGLSYAINRSELIQDAGGPSVSPALTHVLPAGVVGSKNFDLYPSNKTKAKQLLGGHSLTLKMLYQADDPTQSKVFQSVQSNLAAVGVKVTGIGVPSADIYTKYLEVPSTASRGVWDIAITSWYPDWYGNNAVNYLLPLFASTSFPPNSANFSFMKNASIDTLIKKGQTATSQSEATQVWTQTDQAVMRQAPMYPIASPNFVGFHSSLVHNAIYVPNIQQIDPTNVWLSS